MKRFILILIISFQIMVFSHHASSKVKMSLFVFAGVVVVCVAGGVILHQKKKEACDKAIEDAKDCGTRCAATVKRKLSKTDNPPTASRTNS